MTLYSTLALITLCTVIIIDLSGFVDNVKIRLFKWLYPQKEYREYSIKPFDCSFCMSHWINLIYTIVIGRWGIGVYFYILVLAFLTPVFKDIMVLLREIIIKVIDILYTLFKI